MPRFRKLMLIKCTKYFAGECDHTCPHFTHFLQEYCQEDCPSCPIAVRNRCPCVDPARVEDYWQQAIDEHSLFPIHFIVPSTLVPQTVPPPALVQAIRRRGGLVFPLVVRPCNRGKRERYEVVASQEVYDAAREAGIDRVPVIVKRRLSDKQARELIREIPLYLGINPDLYLGGEPEANVLQFPVRGQPERPHGLVHTKAQQYERAAL
jgi:hypothetical protein